jgi:RNA polymerase sigma-70 factor (ECF subfamily)
VTAGTGARDNEEVLLAAAVDGDERAFQSLTERHRRALHLHCYRMLGSLHDADDAVQETWLRAWRSLGRFEPKSTLAAWLHSIATNVCLTALERRRRRPDVSSPDVGETVWREELLHVQPYPDRLLDQLDPAATPETRYELRESVALAFVTAVQLLPPKQRAVLILRDVLGWSAREAADTLGDSVPAVNSALQRARATLERARRLGATTHVSPDRSREQALLRRFMTAWDAVDIDGLVQLLARDALLTMPPVPMYVRGAKAIGEFFATVPADGRLDEIRLVPTAANRQPALAAYVRSPPDGVHRAYGVMVFALDGDSIAGIVGFADSSLFEQFGLPLELAE